MREFTYSEARQHLSELLEQVTREGEVRIRRRDGSRFVVRLETPSASPLDVAGIQAPIGLEALLEGIHESREARY